MTPSSSTAFAASSIAATTRPASPSSATAPSSCGAAPASWRLEEVIATNPLEGEYGIGHTRWATRGRPTEENAHPHRDCTGRIVVVHNGSIIENYLDLKTASAAARRPQVRHQNNTEIVAHLVEREMKDDGLENAVRRALLYMRGLFGLVLIRPTIPTRS